MLCSSRSSSVTFSVFLSLVQFSFPPAHVSAAGSLNTDLRGVAERGGLGDGCHVPAQGTVWKLGEVVV